LVIDWQLALSLQRRTNILLYYLFHSYWGYIIQGLRYDIWLVHKYMSFDKCRTLISTSLFVRNDELAFFCFSEPHRDLKDKLYFIEIFVTNDHSPGIFSHPNCAARRYRIRFIIVFLLFVFSISCIFFILFLIRESFFLQLINRI